MSERQTLVPAEGNGLLSVSDAERLISELTERQDTEALWEVRNRAAAYRSYWLRRQEGKYLADTGSRVKVLAEAAIGAVDLGQYPWRSQFNGAGGEHLIVDGRKINGPTRRDWRLLAIAQEQGLFQEACDELAADPEQALTTQTAARLCRERGAGYIHRQPFREAYKRSGATKQELAERIDAPVDAVDHMLRTSRGVRIAWSRAALRLATELGVPASEIRPRPSRRWQRQRPRGRVVKPRKLRGGRWDKAYTASVRLREEVFAITGESGEPELWRLLHAVEDILKVKL